ncbi:MAG: hypothetical protein P4N59_07445 [Negativicutes bacterium]|nr:hypothetical protein [Negativicutes bacterium]
MQPTFGGGEFDPHLWFRLDLQKYATGLRTCRNFYIHKHGSASTRPGQQFVNAAKFGATRCRLMPFIFSDKQAYVLEIGVGYIRFYTNDALIVNGGSPVEVTTPYQEADLRFIDITQSADTLYIACAGYPPQVLTRITPTNWTFAAYTYHDGPFLKANTDSAFTITPSGVTGSVTLTATKALFQAGHVGALFRLDQDVQGQSIARQSFAAVGASSGLICGANWYLVTHGTWTGTIAIERSYDNGVTWEQVRAFSATGDMNHNVYGSESVQCQVRMHVTSYTSGPVVADLSTDPFVQSGVAKISAVADTMHATATVQSALGLGSTIATDNWYEGAWSNVQGWPGTTAFWFDRLTWAGSLNNPHGFWCSQPADYPNFLAHLTEEASDGIADNLTARRMDAIKSLTPFRSILVALTGDGEFSIASTNNAGATPSTTAARAEGYRGSADVKPITIGNRIVYVQSMGSTVRDLAYDLYTDSYTGDDLSIYSQHLVKDNNIVEMAYQQEPDSIIWAPRTDGVLLSCTYLKEQEMLAWAHHDTQGIYESVCTVPGAGYNEVWFAVQRSINGSTVRYIERMVKRLPTTNPADQFCVDAGLQYNGAPATVISGLGHLEGAIVKVVGDGNVYPDAVVHGGSITIDPAASKVTVGLGYQCQLETLNLEVPNAVKGTSQGQSLKIGSLVMRLLNSRGGKIGQDSSNLQEWDERYGSDLMGQALALYSGDVIVKGGFDYAEGGRVFFQQDDPMPVTILAFIPGVTVGGLGAS